MGWVETAQVPAREAFGGFRCFNHFCAWANRSRSAWTGGQTRRRDAGKLAAPGGGGQGPVLMAGEIKDDLGLRALSSQTHASFGLQVGAWSCELGTDDDALLKVART
ncbi:hypothetical protein J1614_009795 [Plenodomus biglobosus]|nr:hypothetical protein J1614_009795 [Plenodomus biglobosus]